MSKAKTNNSNGSVDSRRQEVQRIVKNACDQLNSEGVDARNYVEQLAWLFFLKAFDEAETRREEEAAFDDAGYERRLSGQYAWSSWASKTDHPNEMLEFVNSKLWTKLTSPDPKKGLGDDPLAERFRRVFDNVRNYCRRGASFARVVAQVNKLHFSSDTDVHVLSEIYEDLLKRVAADSAGYAGEFYTQRHIIRAMVEVVHPQVGDKVYDPCFGTCGFLGEAADYMRDPERNPKAKQLSGRDLEKLQSKTFYGLEIKPLTYLLGTMNMILHGIESANLELGNTLEVHSDNISEKDRYDVILSNPPYGGKMASELQTNFRVRSAATECLFLQHIMRNLAKGGRAAVIVPEGVLTQENANEKVRKELLEHFNVHTVLSLPAGCFLPYTNVKTSILFFDRPSTTPKQGEWATRETWFYELTNDGFECKTSRKPIAGGQLPDFLAKQSGKSTSEQSWSLTIAEIKERQYELAARNPNRQHEFDTRSLREVLDVTISNEAKITELLQEIEEIVANEQEGVEWPTKPLCDVAEINPRRPSELRDLPDNHIVTFVPMPAVNQYLGVIDDAELRPFAEVRKGFTYFSEGDVIFAKITPCMQNGKSAVASNLSNELGFGSTEFHVIRPNTERVHAEWIWLYVRRLQFRVEGTHQFRGAVGQQRVPATYLENAEIPLPEPKEQVRVIRLVTQILNRISDIEMLKAETCGSHIHLEALRDAVVRKAFAGEL
ncbi:N-6 DNA methylase [Gimesia maris]|uniref:N-6 DNA methylase n=1 Tax=Gimesia maris TaxID=122 RepID=UPI00241D4362|nr:N-6 DNA methylase [Gimesia maris]|tara:strand:+ start:8962 stop:11121 length:2160 start_codon:yes stop_codon:yes gene_type:complete